MPDQGVTISNDGATIMKLLDIVHPAAKTLVNISMSQDAEVSVFCHIKLRANSPDYSKGTFLLLSKLYVPVYIKYEMLPFPAHGNDDVLLSKG